MTKHHSSWAEGAASEFRKILLLLNERHDALTQAQRNDIRTQLSIAVGGFTNEGALDTQIVKALAIARSIFES